VEVGPLDVEEAGGGGEVPAVAAQDALDVLALALGLEVLERNDGQGGGEEEGAGLRSLIRLEEGGRELVRGERIGSEDDEALGP
jgi:hypothetical protein